MSKGDRRDAARPPKSVIFGCKGPALGPEERDFFAAADPLGFILFGRNCVSPDQLRALISDLRETVGRPDAPVLIDQEGGRIARLKPPHWRRAPAAARFGALARGDEEAAMRAVWLNGRLFAAELRALGISVDCAPVLDVPASGSHDIVGDRAFAGDPELVARLGRGFCDGLLAGGVLPVVKHIPGHGRARADSHKSLPVVEASLAELRATDFRPFVALKDAPIAMTAHLLYSAIDEARPATQSRGVIEEIIRGEIGFTGLLLSDDLSMGALAGGLGERAERSLEAGCDVVLHCNAKPREMAALAEICPELGAETARRLSRTVIEQQKDINFKSLCSDLDKLIEPSMGS
ncbi:MAG: beta-N-acetylhexosaminidase [Alphaproteobacteria bacterium]